MGWVKSFAKPKEEHICPVNAPVQTAVLRCCGFRAVHEMSVVEVGCDLLFQVFRVAPSGYDACYTQRAQERLRE